MRARILRGTKEVLQDHTTPGRRNQFECDLNKDVWGRGYAASYDNLNIRLSVAGVAWDA